MTVLTRTCQQMASHRVLLILGDTVRCIMLTFISSSQKHLQHNVNAVSTIFINRCKNYALGYIDDNSNIKADFLAKDGIHLNETGKSSLANNFINFINRYIL